MARSIIIQEFPIGTIRGPLSVFLRMPDAKVGPDYRLELVSRYEKLLSVSFPIKSVALRGVHGLRVDARSALLILEGNV